MAAKGAESKATVTDKILNTFDGAFIASDGKTIRVPLIENGEPIEIKVTLTAAKDLEGNGNLTPVSAFATEQTSDFPAAKAIAEPTEEEKEQVRKLLGALNF